METTKDFILERLHFKGEIILDKPEQSYTCGREKENEIVCLSLLVSRKHCIFFHGTHDLYVTDLKSSNGIYINGTIQKPYQMVKLYENDIIGIGCSETDPNNAALFAYKVGVIKTSVPAEQTNSSLSKTISNYNNLSEKSVSHTGRILGQKCGSNDTVNCDVAVPCKIAKTSTINEIDPDVNFIEVNINSCDNNQNSCSNNTNNLMETSNDLVKIEEEDDIEIIPTFLIKDEEENLKNNKSGNNRFKYPKCPKDDSKSSSDNIIRSRESNAQSKNYERIDIFIDEDESDNNGNRSTNRKKNRKNVDDKSNKLHLTKDSNLVHTKNNVKVNESRITDNKEEACSAAVNDKKTHDITPIKLKRLKEQKQKTRFSEIDVVDLTDDEDGIFPYSQLFDIEFGNNADSKIDIKQEYTNIDTEKIGLPDVDDEIIILTDSEDEDNPWLQRLSRSQVLNEEKDFVLTEPVVKNEIDLGIWEEDDISNIIIRSEVSDTAKVPNLKEKPARSSISGNKRRNASNSLLITNASRASSSNESCSKNHTREQTAIAKKDTHLTKKVGTVNASSMNGRKQVLPAITLSKNSKVLIPVIKMLDLPSTSQNICNNRQNLPKEKTSSKLAAQEKKILKLQEKREQYLYNKEQKHRRVLHKWAIQCLPPNKTKRIFISKEEKRVIIEDRKAKLKQIAAEKKKLSAERNQNIQTAKQRTAKAKAKISLKNRGDFLINMQETTVSKSSSNQSTKLTESINNQCKEQLTDETDVLKKSVTSHVKKTRSYQEKNLSKEIENHVATTLQRSLHLNNDTSDTIQISKKKNNTKNSEKIDDLNKKRSSSKVRKKSNEHSTDTKISKSPDKSLSTYLQKENFSPDHIDSKLIKPKKKVTFSGETKIRLYEIDPQNSLKRLTWKDAPIPTNKLSRSSTTRIEWSPKLEEFLLRIFSWNPTWLEEQRCSKTLPPILAESELQPMRLCYDSFINYYKVVFPLLLLEIWHSIAKDFETIEKKVQRATAMCAIAQNSITHTPIPSTNLFLTTFILEILVSKDNLNKPTHPIYGDLVSFEYAITIDGRQVFQKIFAYITNVHQTVITDFTHYNRDLRNYVKNPYAVITYTMLTRSLEHNILVNRIQRVRTITYLRANIRMVQALQYLPQSPLVKLILNPTLEDYQLPPMNKSHTYSSLVTNDQLNPKQLEAVFRVTEAVLRKEAKLCFIQGPPGTGKSKVIVNLVTQILYGKNEGRNKKSLRILVCAPSNAAIDEIVIRLLAIRPTFKQKRFNMVRIGRPETMHPTAKAISVTELAKRHLKTTTEKIVHPSANDNQEDKAILEARIKSFENELASSQSMDDQKRRQIKRKLIDVSTRYELLNYGKSIEEFSSKERARFQRISEDTIIAGADIITCTLSSCYTNQMESIFGGNKEKISVCIVDEATQSCEAESLIPLMLGINTLVLVGDPNQLPATILSQQAKKLGLDQSIFSRIQNVFVSHPNNPIIMLDTQYRMAHSISYWPNWYFYAGKLKNAVENRTKFPYYPYRVLYHDSAQNNDKFSNTTEAEFVANIVFTILQFTEWENIKSPISLGILTPYNNQRAIVSNKIIDKISCVPNELKKKINFEVNTVDGFQGQERDIIIMSCVRSHGIGFLSDKQRLCVALTRAKHALILCGNFNTFMKDRMWNMLLSDADSRGVLCNVSANAKAIAIKPLIFR